MSTELAEYRFDSAHTVEENTSFIPPSDPDITSAELSAMETLLCSQQFSSGRIVGAFEHAFAAYLGRKYALRSRVVPSGPSLQLRALGTGSRARGYRLALLLSCLAPSAAQASR